MNTDEYISHHGIPGQKWGIRRYQNGDGSLTPAGRKRAQKLKTQYKTLTGKKLKGKIPKDEDLSKKRVKDLSDTQLKSRITRLRSEKELRGLERDLSSNGQKFFRSVGRDVMAPAAINAGKRVMEDVFFKGMSKTLGMDKDDAKDSYNALKRSAEVAEFKSRKAKAEKSLRDIQKQEKRKAEKQQAQEENKQKPKEKVVTGNVFVFNSNKTYDRYAEEGKNIMDATWEEIPQNENRTRKKGK